MYWNLSVSSQINAYETVAYGYSPWVKVQTSPFFIFHILSFFLTL